MPAKRTYVRPMTGWWRHHAFYRWYMVREASSVIVTAYALVLLTGLWRLTQGETAFNAWRVSLTSPISIVFHLLALWLFIVHTLSWFRVMPKTMPFLRLGGKRVADATIIRAGLTAAAACTVGTWALFKWVT